MPDTPFDPYHMWLGIPPEDQPPNLYRLLSTATFEQNLDVIEAASQRQINHLRTYATGPNSELSQELLNEVAAARVTLLNPARKAEYDQALMQSQAASKIDQERSQQPIESPAISAPASATPPSFSPSVTPSPKKSRGKAKKTTNWSKPLVGSIALAATVVLSFVLVKAFQKDTEVAQAPPRTAIQPKQPSNSQAPTTQTFSGDQQQLSSSAKLQNDKSSQPSESNGIESFLPTTTTDPKSDPTGTSLEPPTNSSQEDSASPSADLVPLAPLETTDAPQVPADAPPPANAPFDVEQAKNHQELWAEHLGLPVEFTDSIGMKFKLIPPGKFLMGDPQGTTIAGAGPHNGVTVPIREITISEPFFLAAFEVTQSQYANVMGTAAPTQKDGSLPISRVSWQDSITFCQRLSQRSQSLGKDNRYALPSESQWEYACRAGSQTRYFFGDDATLTKDYAVTNESGARGPMRVGSKKPNAWGLSDMHGNLWEWCNDWYGVYKMDTPFGPPAGKERIQRGGSWNIAGTSTGYRNMNPPQLQHNLHGFRVALQISDQMRASGAGKTVSTDRDAMTDQDENRQPESKPTRRTEPDNTNELANRIVGETLRVDHESPRSRNEIILHPDGTWICHTTVRKTSIIAGQWVLREGKIFAYESNRTDEGNGAIYNVFFLDDGQLRTEHFYRNAKANYGTVTIVPTTTVNESQSSFTAGQYVVEDRSIDKRTGGSRLMFEFSPNGDFGINGIKNGTWKMENGLLQIKTFSRKLQINPCLVFKEQFTGTYLNANQRPFYLVGSLNK
ncbi:MAG: formylglycine-generating enzyme family protein [Rubripirellula sp.]|nr:formylglycine-generating enzyme family protein [Rubripirellula sp.]